MNVFEPIWIIEDKFVTLRYCKKCKKITIHVRDCNLDLKAKMATIIPLLLPEYRCQECGTIN